MKKLIPILFFLLTFNIYSQDITVVHFNYKWNSTNAYKGLDRLKNVKVQYAYVEDQSESIQKSIKSVPTIVIYKDGKPANIKSVVISTQHSADVNQSQVRELVKPYIEKSIPKNLLALALNFSKGEID